MGLHFKVSNQFRPVSKCGLLASPSRKVMRKRSKDMVWVAEEECKGRRRNLA
jgi:hypothetical protein